MTWMESDTDFNILVKLSEYGNHPIQGEAFELGVSKARKLRMRDACQPFCLTDGKAAIVKRADDLRRKNGTGLLNVGVNPAQVPKYIAAAADEFQFIVHSKASFNRFRRSRMRSTAI